MPDMIQLHDVTKTYPAPAGAFAALRGVDLTLERGALVALRGRSGSGKSTLLHLMGGIDQPSAGRVVVDGTELQDLGPADLARWRGRVVGFVFQSFQLMPTLTAQENVLLPMDLLGRWPVSQRRARARTLLERFGVAAQQDKLPAALSGGEQQRVAIARALANEPALVLADEPTGNLDSTTGGAVLDLFRELARAGTTVVIATHEPDIAARVDRCVTLHDGVLRPLGAA